MADEKVLSEFLAFADKHLSPYKVREKQDGTTEIVPKYCPFCHGGDNGDEDSFALSVDHGVYVCKRGSCGQRGRFSALSEYLGDSTDIKLPTAFKKKKGPVQYILPEISMQEVTEEIYRYFETRKISRTTVDAFHIASDDRGNIVFPFYMNGENVFVKLRRPYKLKPGEKAPKEWRVPGTKAVLFGMDDCSFARPLVITEGQIDAMALYEAGITNVVSVPSGCEDTSWIENCWEWLERFHQIILFGDSDGPGRRMVREVAKRLDETRCLIVEDYPDRPDGKTCKDANEVLFFCGEFKLIEMVETAKEIPVKGLIDLSEVSAIDPTQVPRIKTMIPALDSLLGGLVEGGVTVFTGKAGQGKSTLTGLLLLNAIEQGYNVCAYSGELRKEKFQEWINLQAAGSDWIGLKYDPVRDKRVPCVPYLVSQRLLKWYAGKFFLFDNNEIFEHNQAESIIEVFTIAVKRHGCKLFLVDNMMTAMSDAEEETKAQGRFVAALKKFATRYGVHVLVVAHPRKTRAGETLRKDDVGGNSAIVNLSDSAIVVEKPNLRIIKNREGGMENLIECVYCPDSRRIYQCDCGDLNHFSWDRESLTPPLQKANSLPEYQEQLGETLPI